MRYHEPGNGSQWPGRRYRSRATAFASIRAAMLPRSPLIKSSRFLGRATIGARATDKAPPDLPYLSHRR